MIATEEQLFLSWWAERDLLVKIEEDFSHERDPRDEDYRWWIERLRPLAEVRRLFGYVNNHYTGFGPSAAQRMVDALTEDA